ncbi:hypothetical protein ABK040_000806 [Willaertia magna]
MSTISAQVKEVLEKQKQGDIQGGFNVLVSIAKSVTNSELQSNLLHFPEGIDDLCSLMNNKEVNFKFVTLNIISNFSAVNPTLADEFVKRSDIFDEINTLLKEHKTNASVLRDATALVRNAAKNASNRPTLIRKEVHNACSELIPYFLKAVKQTELFLENICGGLALLSQGNGEVAEKIANDLKVISYMKTLLTNEEFLKSSEDKKNVQSQRLMKISLQLVHYLSHASQNNQKLVVQEGLPNVLASLLSRYQDTFPEAGQLCTNILHTVGQSSLAATEISEETLSSLIKDLKTNVPQKQKKACESLWSATDSEENLKPILESEAPDLLIQCLSSEYAQIIEPATGALSVLVRSPQMISKLARSNVLSLLASFMKQCSDSTEKIVLNSIAICVYLGNNTEVIQALNRYNFATICIQVFGRYFELMSITEVSQTQYQILIALLKLFSNFARTPESALKLKDLGLVDELIEVLKKEANRQNFEIRKQACETLYNIYKVDAIREYIDSINDATGLMASMISVVDLSSCDRVLNMRNQGVSEEELRAALDKDEEQFVIKDLSLQFSALDMFDDDEDEDDDEEEEDEEELKPAELDEDDELKPASLDEDDELEPVIDDDDEAKLNQNQDEDEEELKPAELDEDEEELKPAELDEDEDDELKPAELDEDEELQPSILDEEFELEEEMNRKIKEEEEESKKRDDEYRKKREEKERLKQQKILMKQLKKTEEIEQERKKQEEEVKAKEKRAAKRKAIAKELLSTEESYVKALDVCQKHFMEPIISGNYKILPKDKFDIIFKDIDLIHKVNHAFLQKLKVLFSNEAELLANIEYKVGELIISYSPSFKMYCGFVNNYDRAEACMYQCMKNYKGFADLLSQVSDQLLDMGLRQTDLGSFLIQPVQRLPRYNLLLTDLLKNSENTESTGFKFLKRALNETQEITNFVNEAKRGVEHITLANKLIEKLKISEFPRNPERKYILSQKGLHLYMYERRRIETRNKSPYKMVLHVLSDYIIIKRGKAVSKKVHLFSIKDSRIRKKAEDMDKQGLSFTIEDEAQSKITQIPMEYEVKCSSKEERDSLYQQLSQMHTQLRTK